MMLKAQFMVLSTSLSLDQISEGMGSLPDSGYSDGDPIVRSGKWRKGSLWGKRISWAPGRHGGVDGLAEAIEELGLPLAARARALVDKGCHAVVSVCQELLDDSESTGFHLSLPAIEWMAAAGAELDIDQYVGLVEVSDIEEARRLAGVLLEDRTVGGDGYESELPAAAAMQEQIARLLLDGLIQTNFPGK